MSAFGGGSTFQIFSDSSTSENQSAAHRRPKRVEVTSKATAKQPASKRPALGEISSNNTRVQPLRAVKQGQPTLGGHGGFGLENAGTSQNRQKICSAQPFSIHVDGSSQPAQVTRVPVYTHSRKPTVASRIVASVATLSTRREPSSHPSKVNHLPSAVTAVPTFNTPISEPIVIDDSDEESSGDSPMLLDNSDAHLERLKREQLDQILTVPEYAEAIYLHLLEIETRHYPAPYAKTQQDITENMRNILVDWLIEVQEEYKLHRETLFLCVNYVDRFLSGMAVNRKKLQLVGATSMFLAAKYEEIYPPEVSEFVYITDNTYEKEEVLRMENLMLKILKFDLAVPTANMFCEKYLKDCQIPDDDVAYFLTMYLAELTIMDTETYLTYRPSIIAASCVLLANHTLRRFPAWPSLMMEKSKYCVAQLASCVQALFQTYHNAPNMPQQAIFEKYKQPKNKEVSNIPRPKALPAGCMIIPRS